MNTVNSDKPIEIGIVFGSLFNGNLGVQALTFSLISLLESASEKLGRPIRYTVFESTKNAASGNLELLGKSVPFTAVSFAGFGKKLWFNESGKQFLRLGREMDVVFDIGGGDSFSDIYGKKRFFSLWMTKEKLRAMGTPVVMTPQTIGPFKHWLVKWGANRALNRIAAVYSRDQLSTAYLKGCLPSGTEIKEFVDMAFFLPFKKEEAQAGSTKVGLNVSGLLYNGGYTKNNQFELATNYREMIRGLILKLSKDESIDLRLVPHVITRPSHVENDLETCQSLAKEFDLAEPPHFKTPIEAKSYISGMSFFMGARMHSTIAAYSSGVPVLPMAYSRKFNGLFVDSLGLSSMIDLKVDSLNTIMEKVELGLANRDALKSEMATTLERIKIQRDSLIDCFAENISAALKDNSIG